MRVSVVWAAFCERTFEVGEPFHGARSVPSKVLQKMPIFGAKKNKSLRCRNELIIILFAPLYRGACIIALLHSQKTLQLLMNLRNHFTLYTSLSITHYSRTIHGQYTHNKRTIPYTSQKDRYKFISTFIFNLCNSVKEILGLFMGLIYLLTLVVEMIILLFLRIDIN